MLLHTMLIATLFSITKLLKEPRYLPTDKEVKNVWYIYVSTHIHAYMHNEILFSHEKEGTLAFCDKWMYLKGIIYVTKIRQK